MEDIEHFNIPVYNFPYDIEEDDEDTIQDNQELRVRIFFLYTSIILTSLSHYFPSL